MNRLYALEFVRVTEASALASAIKMGHGNEKQADTLAVKAMRSMLSTIDFDGTVRIGEGERDKAPMLYIGEKVGTGHKPELDVALDPLEGTTICAKGGYNALSVIAVAKKGNFLYAPDVYMNKIATGKAAKNCIDINRPPLDNLKAVAKAKQCRVQDLTVVIMDRPRHHELIDQVRNAGARIRLILDGDIQPALACGLEESGVDLLMGIGGAPEGVLSAAALRCLDGGFQAQLVFHKKGTKAEIDYEQIDRAKNEMGITDLDRTYQIEDLASGPVIFCATGVTEGSLLDGVSFKKNNKASTHSIVMRSQTGTVRFIKTEHDLSKKNHEI